MRRITLAALVVMSIGWGLPAAYAAESSSGADTIEPQHATVPNTSLVTSVSPPPSGKAESLQRHAAPDCDGEAPSTSPVTALLSRLVRSSSGVRGVQCPMPLVPDKSPLEVEELHP